MRRFASEQDDYTSYVEFLLKEDLQTKNADGLSHNIKTLRS